VVVGNGSASNLAKALKGETPFGAELLNPPPGTQFSRMPAALSPVSDADIVFFQTWIDDGCPEDPLPPGHSNLCWRQTNAPIASSHTDDLWFLDPRSAGRSTAMARSSTRLMGEIPGSNGCTTTRCTSGVPASPRPRAGGRAP
jgi:hypothetical protein